MEDTQEVQPITTRDMLNQALEGNPINMASIFNDLVMGKIAGAVADRKSQLAQTMFADDQEDEDDFDDEESDEELEQQEDEAEDEDTESDA